jgi:hypothetical protein
VPEAREAGRGRETDVARADDPDLAHAASMTRSLLGGPSV